MIFAPHATGFWVVLILFIIGTIKAIIEKSVDASTYWFWASVIATCLALLW